jgi:hypothetical protein
VPDPPYSPLVDHPNQNGKKHSSAKEDSKYQFIKKYYKPGS